MQSPPVAGDQEEVFPLPPAPEILRVTLSTVRLLCAWRSAGDTALTTPPPSLLSHGPVQWGTHSNQGAGQWSDRDL